MVFDGEGCIKLLRDKSLSLVDRIATAESLVHFPRLEACKALQEIIIDESDDSELRKEAVECLASLWYEMGYDKKELDSIPKPFQSEILREIQLNKSAEQITGGDAKNSGAS